MREINTPSIHAAAWTLDELTAVYTADKHESNRHSTSGDPQQGGNNRSWYGGIGSIREATELLRNGWQDGATKLQGLIGELTPPQAKSRKRKISWSDEGDDLHIDRAMAGEWDSAWRTSRRVWSAGPQSVTLVTKWGGNCHQSSDELFWQGAAAAVIADALEESGYRVRIVCGTALYSRMTGRDGALLVTLKEEQEPMRIDAMASLMCHAGIFRTYGFRCIEALPFACPTAAARSWSASATDGKGSYQEAVARTGLWPDDAIVLDEVSSRSGCVAEITRVLKSFE